MNEEKKGQVSVHLLESLFLYSALLAVLVTKGAHWKYTFHPLIFYKSVVVSNCIDSRRSTQVFAKIYHTL